MCVCASPSALRIYCKRTLFANYESFAGNRLAAWRAAEVKRSATWKGMTVQLLWWLQRPGDLLRLSVRPGTNKPKRGALSLLLGEPAALACLCRLIVVVSVGDVDALNLSGNLLLRISRKSTATKRSTSISFSCGFHLAGRGCCSI